MPRPVHAVALLLLLVLSGCAANTDSEVMSQGRTIYGDTCSVCHGTRGEGQVGPALAAVTETWPTCDGHVEWIEVGSEGWTVRYGDTYGATAKLVEGGMPAHADKLTLDEMRAVAVFERVAYGGQDESAAVADCQVGG